MGRILPFGGRGILFLILLAVGVFYTMNDYMIEETEWDMREVARIHMQEMADERIGRFNAVKRVLFDRLDNIAAALGRGDRAAVQGFSSIERLTSCALLSDAGTMEQLYGEPFGSLQRPQYVLDTLRQGRKLAAISRDAKQSFIVFAVPASLPMADGGMSEGILCAMSADVFLKTMNLDTNDASIFFHVIRANGDYIVRNAEALEDSYFGKLMKYATPSGMTKEEAVANLKGSIAMRSECVLDVTYDNEATGVHQRRSVLFSPIPESAWYLVTVMPYGALDTMVAKIGGARSRSLWISLTVLTAGLLLVVFLYFRAARRQMESLGEEKERAAEALREADTASQEAMRSKQEAEQARDAAEKARAEAEQAREEAENANRAKSELLSNMSHDVRTPMNAIVGMTAIATEHIDDPVRVGDCLRRITIFSKQLLGLINDVLDMSKIESGKIAMNMEPLSLRQTMETVRDIARPQAKASGQRFEIIVGDILSERVYCDSVRLSQMLLNFLSNAIKFTPAGGLVSVSLRQEESPKAHNMVRTHFYVRDTGMGMSEEFMKRMFNVFAQNDNRRIHKVQGTGLGLAITKYIVDAMGGTIDVSSAPGQGTTFHITLDLERVNEAEGEMKLPPWRLLVVEGSEDHGQAAERILTALGTQPFRCADGSMVLRQVSEAKEEGMPFFAVILDDACGIETAKALRERLRDDCPLLLISTYEREEVEEDARRVGMDGFIEKPVFKSALYATLKEYQENGRAEAIVGPPVRETKPDLAGMRFLLAEDQDINAEIAKMILEESGAQVDHAQDGKVATERFEASSEGYYDAVLMDLRMPNMDGFKATEVIRSMKRADATRIPILAMTADASAEDAQKCFTAGMDAHIAKPIDFDALKKTLMKYRKKQH